MVLIRPNVGDDRQATTAAKQPRTVACPRRSTCEPSGHSKDGSRLTFREVAQGIEDDDLFGLRERVSQQDFGALKFLTIVPANVDSLRIRDSDEMSRILDVT